MLKTLIKDLKEVKNTLREKADLLPKVAQNLFGKRFRSLVVLEVSSSGNCSAPLPAKQNFWTSPSSKSNKPYCRRRLYYSKKH